MQELFQPILLYFGSALGALGVVLAMPRRGVSPQVIGGLVAGGGFGAMVLAVSLMNVKHLPNINFYVFSLIAVGAALRVITHQRPVYSALYFILTILASSGLYVILAAEFMAFALIIVYAGAILITYLFVIMLATEAPSQEQEEALQDYDRYSREPIAATVVGFVLLASLTTMLARGAGTLSSDLAAAEGVVVSNVRFEPGSVARSESGGERRTEPVVLALVSAKHATSGRLEVLIDGKTLDLDPRSLETSMPVTLAAGDNEIGIPANGVKNAQPQVKVVWTPSSGGDSGLLAQLPRKVETALREAKDPNDPTKPLMAADERVASIDARSRSVTVVKQSGPNGDGPTRTITMPADLDVDNVEGVAFTLLNSHPGAIEIAGVILLMAMLGAVVLARKKVEMDDAAKLAAQTRHLVEVGPLSEKEIQEGRQAAAIKAPAKDAAAPIASGGRV